MRVIPIASENGQLDGRRDTHTKKEEPEGIFFLLLFLFALALF